ncbi:MAG: TolC family protein [Deltaproteobacteria bacterium]|nr:TolC family protein [Deltaproteobacteria bacterium]
MTALPTFLALAALSSPGSLTASSTTAELNILEALRPAKDGLSLTEVVERAVKTSPTMKNADAQMERAASLRENAVFGFVPRVDLSLGYTRLSRVEQGTLDVGGMSFGNLFPQLLDNYSAVGSVSIPATQYFLSIIHGYRAAHWGEQAASAQTEAQRSVVALGSLEAFFVSIRARAALLVAERSVAVLRLHLADLERLEAAGLATRGDLMQAKAQVARAVVEAQRARGGYTQARAALRTALHLDETAPIEHTDELFLPKKVAIPNYRAALEEALRQRPEIEALEKLVETNREWAAYYGGEQLPKLSLDGTILVANPNSRVFPSVEEFRTTWQVGVNLRWSPNDFAAARTQRKTALADMIAREADLASVKDGIAVEVSAALAALRTGLESIEAAQEELDAAEAFYHDKRQLLAAGDGTSRDVLDAEEALRLAQLHVVSAHLDARFSELQIARAVGALFERLGLKEAPPS